MAAFLVPVYLVLLYVLPMGATISPLIFLEGVPKWIYLSFTPLIFSLSYVLIAGLLSIPFHKSIVAGRFPRVLSHAVYGGRRLYGLCWTSLFYFTPIYFIFLNQSSLKKAMFRLFGYKANTDFTIFADTWIRDLPMLKIGKDAYLSNRATLGTNLCLKNGQILVDKIEIGDASVVGHLAMVGPGVRLGNGVDIGVGTAVGIRSRIEDGTRISPTCSISHGVVIGKNVSIGGMSLVGLKAVIGEGLSLPEGASIPAGAVVRTKEDVRKYQSSETESLKAHTERMTHLFHGGLAVAEAPEPTKSPPTF